MEQWGESSLYRFKRLDTSKHAFIKKAFLLLYHNICVKTLLNNRLHHAVDNNNNNNNNNNNIYIYINIRNV